MLTDHAKRRGLQGRVEKRVPTETGEKERENDLTNEETASK